MCTASVSQITQEPTGLSARAPDQVSLDSPRYANAQSSGAYHIHNMSDASRGLYTEHRNEAPPAFMSVEHEQRKFPPKGSPKAELRAKHVVVARDLSTGTHLTLFHWNEDQIRLQRMAATQQMTGNPTDTVF